MVIPTDYDPWTRYFPAPIREKWSTFLREIHNYSQDTFWDDLRFPFMGARIDVSGGRINYNYTECTVDFATNARYPEEPVCSVAQMTHKWKEATEVHSHLHWMQEEDNDPNWLMRWRIKKRGTASGAWTNAAPETARIYTYVAGELFQKTEFPAIDMTGVTISDVIDCIIFRDSANASGEFDGADPYTVAARSVEFDIHHEIDAPGSDTEYVK